MSGLGFAVSGVADTVGSVDEKGRSRLAPEPPMEVASFLQAESLRRWPRLLLQVPRAFCRRTVARPPSAV